MAITTCIKCGGTQFEMKETPVRNSAFRLLFVQCASCGGAISVQELDNSSALLRRLAKKLGFTI